MKLQKALPVLLSVLILLPNMGSLFAQETPQIPANKPQTDIITPKTQKAIENGLKYLKRTQSPNGGYKYGSGDDVGITGLAGIAFLSSGSVPGRGKYGKNVDGCLEFILKNSNTKTGYINSGNSRMYQHGFAMLFLAEVFGMSRVPKIRKALIKSVQLLQMCQSPKGGWRYTPTPSGDDISLTVCQMMALRAAKNSGIVVEKSVINKGVKYVESCHMSDGRFSYTPGGSCIGSGYASTAAGVCTLYYAGKYDSKYALAGLKHLAKTYKTSFSSNHYPMYGNYYAVQAMHLSRINHEGKYWNKYYRFISNHLVKTQKSDGSWDFRQGAHYCTAMSLIILQVPNEYLPILQN